MDSSNYRQRVMWHAGFATGDDDSESFVAMLRPFDGFDAHVLEDLTIAALCCYTKYAQKACDQELIAASWDLCVSARIWLGDDSPLVRDHLISDGDRSRISERINALERYFIQSLRHFDFANSAYAVIESIAKFSLAYSHEYQFVIDLCGDLSLVDEFDRADLKIALTRIASYKQE